MKKIKPYSVSVSTKGTIYDPDALECVPKELFGDYFNNDDEFDISENDEWDVDRLVVSKM